MRRIILVIAVVLVLCALAFSQPMNDIYYRKWFDFIEKLDIAERVVRLQIRVIKLEAAVDSLRRGL